MPSTHRKTRDVSLTYSVSNGTTTHQYYYTGDKLTVMTKGSTKLTFTYDAAGAPLTVTYNGTRYYYKTNLQGDVTDILNSSGTTVVSYVYDAYGRIRSKSGSLIDTLGFDNPLRYRGYVYDVQTEFYYLQSRYYYPTWGRFINADAFVTTGQGFVGNNMFAYCNNNPVNYTDPKGTIPFADGFFDEVFAKIGQAIGNYIADWRKSQYEKASNLSYVKTTDEKGNQGVQIIDSHEIRDPIVMYEYIEAKRGDEILGSTTGVMFEWMVHNAAYDIGGVANTIGLKEFGAELMIRGETLDLGKTIYADNHSVMSVAMWVAYGSSAPFFAGYDLAIAVFQ